MIQRNEMILHAHGFGIIKIFRRHAPKSNLQFSCDPSQVTHNILHRTTTSNVKYQQIILQFMEGHWRPRIPKAILKKKNKAGGETLPDFGNYYDSTVMPIPWY